MKVILTYYWTIFFFLKRTRQIILKRRWKLRLSNRTKRKTQITQHQTSPQTPHHSTHTTKHEAKNPDNSHHLVLANSTTRMSSLAVVDCYILRQMGTQLNQVLVLSHLVGHRLLPQECRLRHCPTPRPHLLLNNRSYQFGNILRSLPTR